MMLPAPRLRLGRWNGLRGCRRILHGKSLIHCSALPRLFLLPLVVGGVLDKFCESRLYRILGLGSVLWDGTQCPCQLLCCFWGLEDFPRSRGCIGDLRCCSEWIVRRRGPTNQMSDLGQIVLRRQMVIRMLS